jgi:hypothetical protein
MTRGTRSAALTSSVQGSYTNLIGTHASLPTPADESTREAGTAERTRAAATLRPTGNGDTIARTLALQRTAGNQAVARALGAQRAAAIARDPAAGPTPSNAPGAPAQAAPGAGGKVLDIAFHAFIPGSLGRPFSSFPHAKDLSNQATFDAAVTGVSSPNSWKPEPTYTEADVKDPGSARKVWFFSTDERGFGGGPSHRVGFTGKVDGADVGALASKPASFHHDCSPSHRVRSTDTGFFNSSGETGSVDGVHVKTAPATGVTETAADSGSSSTIATSGAASYAFMPMLSPNIDYKVLLRFVKNAAGGIDVSATIEHNLFPFYELLVNGTSIWTFSATDTGPTLTNLNSSKTDSAAPKTF